MWLVQKYERTLCSWWKNILLLLITTVRLPPFHNEKKGFRQRQNFDPDLKKMRCSKNPFEKYLGLVPEKIQRWYCVFTSTVLREALGRKASVKKSSFWALIPVPTAISKRKRNDWTHSGELLMWISTNFMSREVPDDQSVFHSHWLGPGLNSFANPT